MPNGELTVEQLRFLGSAIAPLGAEGCGDITTRANIQLRGMGVDGAAEIFKGLQEHGLSSVQTGAQLSRQGCEHMNAFTGLHRAKTAGLMWPP